MANKKNRLIGITGGIGAGKSTLSRVLREAGYPVFSADEIARELTAPGTATLRKIARLFGPNTILPSGEMDRAYLRSQIMQYPALRRKLESILHPLIQKRSLSLAKKEFRQGNSLVFYEAPLLFEAKSQRKMDAVICVVAKDSVRVARVMARDHSSASDARKLLRAQMPQKRKVALSDFVIQNNGSLADLKKNTILLLKKIT